MGDQTKFNLKNIQNKNLFLRNYIIKKLKGFEAHYKQTLN